MAPVRMTSPPAPRGQSFGFLTFLRRHVTTHTQIKQVSSYLRLGLIPYSSETTAISFVIPWTLLGFN